MEWNSEIVKMDLGPYTYRIYIKGVFGIYRSGIYSTYIVMWWGGMKERGWCEVMGVTEESEHTETIVYTVLYWEIVIHLFLRVLTSLSVILLIHPYISLSSYKLKSSYTNISSVLTIYILSGFVSDLVHCVWWCVVYGSVLIYHRTTPYLFN